MDVYKNQGGPAFPFQLTLGNGGGTRTWAGMSLRDYFAAQIMCVMMSDAPDADGWLAYARDAYAGADAMLKVRSETDK